MTAELPKIEGPARKKPLCYDPGRRKFITFDDIVSGAERIVPLSRLTREELKQLVVERQRRGPDYRVQAMSGPPMTRDDVIEAIQRDDPFGQVTMEADISHLGDLLAQIEAALGQSP